MANKRAKFVGRQGVKRFFQIPYDVLDSQKYIALSYKAKALLNDLGHQYYGTNNGDLTTAWRIMQNRGWKSKPTLFAAMRELEDARFILRTRQGGKNKANLFAITWRNIDYCGGKLDIRPTKTPLHCWKK